MSVQESKFIRALTIISGSVISALIIGLFGFYSMTIRFESTIEERVNNNKSNYEIQMDQVRSMHNKDIQYLVKDITQIRLDQKEVLRILNK